MILADATGCLRATLAFAALLLAPGYCTAWLANYHGFRERSLAGRLTWSVAFSFAIVPIVAVLVGKYGSLTAVAWLAAFASIGCIALLLRSAATGPAPQLPRLPTTIALAWIAFVFAELIDIPLAHKLYLSVTLFDHAVRTAFVDAVLRTGVPPANPLYWPGHAAPMRYYYFWYVLTAVAARLAHATARQAMIASVAWAGFGLAAIVALYCKHFLPPRDPHAKARWPRTIVAVALLSITGIDILPAIAKALARMPADGDMDWWSGDQIGGWLDSVLWVPHHIAGLICCLVGFLIVWMTKSASWPRRLASAAVAGTAFASAVGLSTWVALAFALVMAIWMLWALVSEPDSRTRAATLALAALVALALTTPYALELRAGTSGVVTTATGGADTAANPTTLLGFGVKHMIVPEALEGIPLVAHWKPTHPRIEDAAVGLVLLAPGYFVELGFYLLVLVAAIKALRAKALAEAPRTATVLALSGLLVTTFVRSTVIANNDFGIRSALIVQFFLLLLAVLWCEGNLGWTVGNARSAMLVLLWIGLAGTVYQAVMLRVFLPAQEALGRAQADGLEARAMATRLGFAAMDPRVPKDAVVQFNTAQPGEFFGLAQVMQAGRQMASALPVCGAAFGGDSSACPKVTQGVADLFAVNQGRALTAEAAQAACHTLGIDDLVATPWDAVWRDTQGWVWSLPLVAETGHMRVLDCRPPSLH